MNLLEHVAGHITVMCNICFVDFTGQMSLSSFVMKQCVVEFISATVDCLCCHRLRALLHITGVPE